MKYECSFSFKRKPLNEFIWMVVHTYRDCIYYVVQNSSMLVNLDFIHWLTNWKHQLWLAKSCGNKKLLYNFYTHSVKSDLISVVIFLSLLNKVGQIDNRWKDQKLRPCNVLGDSPQHCCYGIYWSRFFFQDFPIL